MYNNRSFALKKWFSEILREKYEPYATLLERLAASLVTENDLQDFGKLIAEVYSTGYMKAVSDYKGQVEKLGVKVHVGSE